jgi:polyvinyl alcohol dehydrogenase (cytochrome)
MLGLGIDHGGGGMQWGSAADDEKAYFPITRSGDGLGLAALRLTTGEVMWRATDKVAISAPATVIPGVVFAGATNGTVYAFSTTDGHVMWQFDTARQFETVNGVPAQGGNINGSGPVVAGGMLFVPSGYSDLGPGVRGNVLLAFGIE